MKRSSKSPERSFYNLQVAWLLKKNVFLQIRNKGKFFKYKKGGKKGRLHFAVLISGLTSNWLA